MNIQSTNKYADIVPRTSSTNNTCRIPLPHVTTFRILDYRTFQDSPGGIKSRKRTAHQQRKETLFNRYENLGDGGSTHLGLAFGEVFAIAVIPVTIPFYFLNFLYSSASTYVWTHIETCNAEIQVNNSGSYPTLLKPLCATAGDMAIPGTRMHEVLNFFDYTSCVV